MGIERLIVSNKTFCSVNLNWLWKRFILLFTGIVSLFVFSSCSSTSWVVIEEAATDINDYELISSEYFLDPIDTITPQVPVFNVNLMAVNTYVYAQRVRTERYIQRYRPRLGYVMLGVAGAGLSYYAAFSDQLLQQPTDPQRYSLIGAGTLLTGLSFLNMKAVDEPAKTGETRLLRKTGTVTVADTVETIPYTDAPAFITISYEDSILVNKKAYNFNKNSVSINLAEEVSVSLFGEDPSQEIIVSVDYDTLNTEKNITISSIFEQFVVVDTEVTALRNAAVVDPDNVLTDLAEGSQLQLVEREGDWYKVMYGISETWVAVSDVSTIWRPANFSTNLTVVTIPNIPFGSIDVERDIPTLGNLSESTAAYILSNDQYSGQLSERTYGDRDAELVEEYIKQGFAIRPANIIKTNNVDTISQVSTGLNRLSNLVDANRDQLIVYINGYGVIQNENLYLIGTGTDDNEQPGLIGLKDIFERFSEMNISKIIAFVDIDIIDNDNTDFSYQNTFSEITNSVNRSAIILSAGPNQRSGIYSSAIGEQNRHSIFTYYLADALKQNKTSISQIFDHLTRNVPFRSRSIYDRPQDPVLIGNPGLQLVN